MACVFVRKSSMKFSMRVVLLLSVWAVFPVTSAFAGSADELAQENGILENTQVVLLLLSGLVFVVQSFRVERNFRFILWMGAWLSPSIILRELDVEKLAVPQWMVWIGSGMGRNLIMGIGWIVLGLLALKSFPELKGAFRKIVRSRMAAFMLASVLILFLGSFFDHGYISSDKGKLWEESFEILGYFLLLPAAFLSKSLFPIFPVAHEVGRGGDPVPSPSSVEN